MTNKSKVAIVLPAFNEEKNIGKVLEEAKNLADWLIVVDDGSRDKTGEICRAFAGNVICLRHPVNLGKGAALKTGCETAKKLGADIIVTIDSDGQHPPYLAPLLVEYLQDNNLDFVFTIRQGGDKMPLIRWIGNKTLNLAARYLFNLKVGDIWCGFRAFRAECLEKISWEKCDYSGEIQMALRVGLSGLRYGEYPIPTIYHDNSKGVNIFHGLKVLGQMIIWRVKL